MQNLHAVSGERKTRYVHFYFYGIVNMRRPENTEKTLQYQHIDIPFIRREISRGNVQRNQRMVIP